MVANGNFIDFKSSQICDRARLQTKHFETFKPSNVPATKSSFNWTFHSIFKSSRFLSSCNKQLLQQMVKRPHQLQNHVAHSYPPQRLCVQLHIGISGPQLQDVPDSWPWEQTQTRAAPTVVIWCCDNVTILRSFNPGWVEWQVQPVLTKTQVLLLRTLPDSF